MAINPIIKRREYVNRRGELIVYETRGTSIVELGGKHCDKEYDSKASCIDCPTGNC